MQKLFNKSNSITKIAKDIDEAKENLKKAKQFQQDGKSDKALKEYEAAIKKFAGVLKTNDEEAIRGFLQEAYIAKGDLLKSLGITKEAMSCYQNAAQLGSSEAYEKLKGSSASSIPTLTVPVPNVVGTSSASPGQSPRAISHSSTGNTQQNSKWAMPNKNRSKSSNDVTSSSANAASSQQDDSSSNATVSIASQGQSPNKSTFLSPGSKTPPPTRHSQNASSSPPAVSVLSSKPVVSSSPPTRKVLPIPSGQPTSQAPPSPTLGSRSKIGSQTQKSTQPSAVIFKSNPKPTEVKFKFHPNAKIESTRHLVWLLAQEKDKESVHYQEWISTAADVINLFAEKPSKKRPDIAEVLVLAEIDDDDITTALLEAFISPVKNGTLINPSILYGLAEVINLANPALIQADDFIQILRVLNERLQVTHGQGNAKKLEHLMRALSRLMMAMVDAGVKGIARKNEHQPLYECLRGYKAHQNRRVCFDADLCLQALARLPNDESNLGSFLRRAYHVVKGTSHIATAVLSMTPTEMFDALVEFRKAVSVQLTFKNSWYEDFRYAQLLVSWNHFIAFEEFLKDPKIKQLEDFYIGVLYVLKEVADGHHDDGTRTAALEFIKSLFNNTNVLKFEGVRLEIINVLVHVVREGDPELAHLARGHIKALLGSAQAQDQALIQSVLPDLAAVVSRSNKKEKPVQNRLLLVTLDPSNSTVVDKLICIENYMRSKEVDIPKSVEKKCGLLRERDLSDQFIKDELVTYIPIRGAYRSTDKDTFDMEEKAKEFIRGPRRQLLIIGNAGGGKSTFNRYLLTRLWKDYQEGGVIPIFISLPLTINPVQDLMKEVLIGAGFTTEEIDFLKHNRELVVIVDGYDEKNLTDNLYARNKLSEWINISVIISCRTDYLKQFKDYTVKFTAIAGDKPQPNLFQEVTVVPFSDLQIKAYIAKYIELHNEAEWKSAEQWVTQMNSIPGMRELIETPFLLMIAMEVLPSIVEKYRHLKGAERVKMMQAQLLDEFMENWFRREELKLLIKGQLPADGHDPKEDFWEFAKELGKTMHIKGVKQVTYAPTRSLFRGRDSGKGSPWAMFFSSQNPDMVAARIACPLRKTGQTWTFYHESMIAYFNNKTGADGAKAGEFEGDFNVSDDEESNQYRK